MKLLLVICEDRENDYIVCDCGYKMTVEEDYHDKNMWSWCEKCSTILFCANWENMDTKCAKEISRTDAEQYCLGANLSKRPAKTYYLISTIKITGVAHKKKGPYHPTSAYRLDDIDFDTGHDGCMLYYTATCSECGENYQSKIWGD